MHKYRAQVTFVGDIRFDSKGEAARFMHLKGLQRMGIIQDLQLQPAFDIVHNGVKICKVKLDFSYIIKGNTERVYEDYKGVDLPMSKLKRKLVKAFHGIDVTLIRRPKDEKHISVALR